MTEAMIVVPQSSALKHGSWTAFLPPTYGIMTTYAGNTTIRAVSYHLTKDSEYLNVTYGLTVGDPILTLTILRLITVNPNHVHVRTISPNPNPTGIVS